MTRTWTERRGFVIRASFILNLQTAEFVLLGTESGGDVIEEVNYGERDATAEPRTEQPPSLLIVFSKHV